MRILAVAAAALIACSGIATAADSRSYREAFANGNVGFGNTGRNNVGSGNSGNGNVGSYNGGNANVGSYNGFQSTGRDNGNHNIGSVNGAFNTGSHNGNNNIGSFNGSWNGGSRNGNVHAGGRPQSRSPVDRRRSAICDQDLEAHDARKPRQFGDTRRARTRPRDASESQGTDRAEVALTRNTGGISAIPHGDDGIRGGGVRRHERRDPDRSRDGSATDSALNRQCRPWGRVLHGTASGDGFRDRPSG